MKLRRAICGMACATLAACGGGGSGSEVVDRGQAALALEQQLTGRNIANPADLPTSGRAEYNGYMRARLPTGPAGERVQYLGDMRLDVNFGAAFDQIRGQAGGFEAADRTALAGVLAITGGNIYRDTDPNAAYSFDGDVDGALTGVNGRYVVDAQIEGEFLGRGETAVSGLLFGDVNGPRGKDIFDGTFAGTRRAD